MATELEIPLADDLVNADCGAVTVDAEAIATAIKEAIVECFGDDGTLDVELDLSSLIEAIQGCLTIDNCEGTSLDVTIGDQVLTVTFPDDLTEVCDNGQDALRVSVCDPCPVPVNRNCIEKRTYTVMYDNGFTPGSSSNDCGKRPNFVPFSYAGVVTGWANNGATTGAGAALGPYSTWTPELQGWVDFFNTSGNNGDASATAAFGFIAAPTWRHAEITGCGPDATYGDLAVTYTVNGVDCNYLIHPILTSETVETLYTHAQVDCATGAVTVVYTDADGTVVAAPADLDCWVPCGYAFSEIIDTESDCVSDAPIFACDSATNTPIVVVKTTCPNGVDVGTYTLESWNDASDLGGLVSYTLQGDLVNCETGEPIKTDSLEEMFCSVLTECEVEDPDAETRWCAVINLPEGDGQHTFAYGINQTGTATNNTGGTLNYVDNPAAICDLFNDRDRLNEDIFWTCINGCLCVSGPDATTITSIKFQVDDEDTQVIEFGNTTKASLVSKPSLSVKECNSDAILEKTCDTHDLIESVVTSCQAAEAEIINGLPTVSVYANGFTPDASFPAEFAGAGSGGVSAAYGAPDNTYAVSSIDGTGNTGIALQVGTWDLDTAALPDCEPETVELIIHSAATTEDGVVVPTAIVDGFAWALEVGGTPVVPTSLPAGAGTAQIIATVAANGVTGAGWVSDTTDMIGGSGATSGTFNLTSADIAAGLTVRMVVDNDSYTPANGWHQFNPAIDAIELRVSYPADSDCFEDCPALKTEICGTVDVNLASQDAPIVVQIAPENPAVTCETQYLLGCDDTADGVVQYLIPVVTCYLGDQIVSRTIGDPLAEDGSAYTPTNPIACDPATLDFDEEFYCDANGTSFIRRTIVIAGQGAIVEEVELDGTTPYTPTGPVTQGACEVAEVCETAVAPVQINNGTKCTILAAGQAYTIIVDNDTTTVDGIPIPCGTALTLGCKDCPICDPVEVCSEEPITVIAEIATRTQLPLQKAQAIKAEQLQANKKRSFVTKGEQ